jgi:mannonate dehydratase
MSSGIKLGFGFYHHMLTPENLRFARQCGATHAVVHLVDYFGHAGDGGDNQPLGGDRGWGRAGGHDDRWTRPALQRLKDDLAAEGLELAALENFDPAHWYDVLLDGPRRDEQIAGLQRIVRDLGAVGIPVMGYNFSLAGVASRISGPFARGGAISVGVDGVDDTPIPQGMVWNMIYDAAAAPGVMASITHDELWRRLERFLEEMLPVAEEAGVRLALHPNDPPSPEPLGGIPCLIHSFADYRRAFALAESHCLGMEFCCGCWLEGGAGFGDMLEGIRTFGADGRILIVHFRNVSAPLPRFVETFLDNGYMDMYRVMKTFYEVGYRGTMILDHSPRFAGPYATGAGAAYAIGYMRALMERAAAEIAGQAA